MIRVCILAAAILTANASSAQVPPAPSSLSDFTDISCGDSKLRVAEGDACGMWRGTQTGAHRYQGAHYLTRGLLGVTEYKATMSYAYDPETWALVVHTQDLPGYMMSYDGITQGASSWSEMAKAGQDFVRPFTSGSKRCFAFHRRGPAWGSGTKSRTTGWFCDDAKPEGWTAEQMQALLATVRFDD